LKGDAVADRIVDRRASERVATRSLIEVKIPDWEAFRRVHAINLSRGGMQLSLGQSALIGTTIDIILTLPNGRRLHLPGEIARLGGATSGDVGVRFSELPPKTSEEIDGYLQELRDGKIPNSATPPGGVPTGWLIKKKS
jgi:hypothetical protein